MTDDGRQRAEKSVANAQKMIDGASQVAIKREQPDDAPPPKRSRQEPKISFVAAGALSRRGSFPALANVMLLVLPISMRVIIRLDGG